MPTRFVVLCALLFATTSAVLAEIKTAPLPPMTAEKWRAATASSPRIKRSRDLGRLDRRPGFCARVDREGERVGRDPAHRRRWTGRPPAGGNRPFRTGTQVSGGPGSVEFDSPQCTLVRCFITSRRRQERRMTDTKRDNTNVPSPPNSVVMSDLAYMGDPHSAFARMRGGADIIVQPTNGCARMVLSAELISDVQLDE